MKLSELKIGDKFIPATDRVYTLRFYDFCGGFARYTVKSHTRIRHFEDDIEVHLIESAPFDFDSTDLNI